MHFIKTICAAALAGASLISAQQSASSVASALEELAFQTYGVRPIVQTVSPANVEKTLIGQGPVIESINLMSQMVSTILANVAALNGTKPFLDSNSEFAIAQGYSDFTQGLLELCDAFTAAAATLSLTDPVTVSMVYGSIREVQAAVDAYFFYIIALTPTNPDATTQKNRLDNHFVQAAAAWHLISQPMANIPAYGSLANTTVKANSTSSALATSTSTRR